MIVYEAKTVTVFSVIFLKLLPLNVDRTTKKSEAVKQLKYSLLSVPRDYQA